MEPIAQIIISALVGAIFGGAIATLGGVVPLRNQVARLELSLERRVTPIEVEIRDVIERIESIKRDGRRRTTALLRALGRRDLIDADEDD